MIVSQQESMRLLHEIGRIIRRKRTERGLGQRSLGKLAGVHPNTILNIENGRYGGTLQTILSLAVALDIEPKDLFPCYPAKDGSTATSATRCGGGRTSAATTVDRIF